MTDELEKEIDLKGMSASHRLSATKFLEEVVELASKGYVLHPKPMSIRQVPNFMGAPRATMVTKERAEEIMKGSVKEPTKLDEVVVELTTEVVEEVKVETYLDKLKDLTTKADLLSFAKGAEIEVPEATVKKGAKLIKQYLVNKLSE